MTNRTDYDEWASAALASMWDRCELRAAEVLAWLDEEWLLEKPPCKTSKETA